MRMIMVVTMGLLCSIAPKAYSQAVESAKAESGLRFLESGKDRSSVQAPSAVGASASASHDSGLIRTRLQMKIGSTQNVPSPTAEKTGVRYSMSKGQIAGVVVGGVVGAIIGAPAIGSGIPVVIAVTVAGAIIFSGAVIGYGLATLAERAYDAAAN